MSCKYCTKILGPYCIPHEEISCPLKKASFCSICGKGKHVNSECMLAPRISKSKKSIDYEQVIYTEKAYMISETKQSYKGYKELHGITNDNDKCVKKHLLERGFTPVHPCKLPPFFIPNNNDAYKEYLKKYDLHEYASVNLNRGTVTNHLEERGYILKHQDKK